MWKTKRNGDTKMLKCWWKWEKVIKKVCKSERERMKEEKRERVDTVVDLVKKDNLRSRVGANE